MSVTFDIKTFNTQGNGPRFAVGAYPPSLRGLIVQPFLEKVPGKDEATRRNALLAAMKTWAALGCVAWAPHSFTTVETPADAAAYVGLGNAAGLGTILAFGLDESDPEGKATRIAALAKTPGVAGVIQDQEGAWEGHPASVDAQDAVLLGNELLKMVPGLVVIDQPWPVPQVHREFPLVAMSRSTSAHAPQFYFGPYAAKYGSQRLRVLAPQFADNWVALERDVLAPSGVGGLPQLITLEGYGYGDIAADYINFVLQHETIIFWCEWQPDATCLHAMDVRRRIDQAVRLYLDDAWSGGDAVLRWQRAFNKTATPATRLVEDGVWGPACERAMFGTPMTRLLATLRRGLGL